MRLEFKNLDIDKHRELILQYRADSFVVSFGNADLFYGEDMKGAERYLELLRQRSQFVGSCVHAAYQGQIVGQIELRASYENANEGYVNLFYLSPEFRGLGLGIQLDQYAEKFFRQNSMKCAYLNVSPTNTRALKFYEKCGWVKEELIFKSGADVFVMKKTFSESLME